MAPKTVSSKGYRVRIDRDCFDVESLAFDRDPHGKLIWCDVMLNLHGGRENPFIETNVLVDYVPGKRVDDPALPVVVADRVEFHKISKQTCRIRPGARGDDEAMNVVYRAIETGVLHFNGVKVHRYLWQQSDPFASGWAVIGLITQTSWERLCKECDQWEREERAPAVVVVTPETVREVVGWTTGIDGPSEPSVSIKTCPAHARVIYSLATKPKSLSGGQVVVIVDAQGIANRADMDEAAIVKACEDAGLLLNAIARCSIPGRVRIDGQWLPPWDEKGNIRCGVLVDRYLTEMLDKHGVTLCDEVPEDMWIIQSVEGKENGGGAGEKGSSGT